MPFLIFFEVSDLKIPGQIWKAGLPRNSGKLRFRPLSRERIVIELSMRCEEILRDWPIRISREKFNSQSVFVKRLMIEILKF